MAAKVSVLIPVRNGEDSIRRSVESILNQTFTELKVLVINDGSTDGTGNVLRQILKLDNRVQIIDQPPLGIVSALNKGLSIADTPYIMRLDADDIAPTKRIESQVDFFKENNSVAVYGGQMERRFPNGDLLGFTNFPTGPIDIKRKLRELSDFFTVAHPSVAFNTQALPQNFFYREHFRFAEDYDLWLRLTRDVRFENSSEVFCINEYNPVAARKTHPLWAYRSVLLAYTLDLVARSDPKSEPYKMHCNARLVDVARVLTGNEHVGHTVLKDSILLAWKLRLSVRCASRVWRILTSAVSNASLDAALSTLSMSEPAITSVPYEKPRLFSVYFKEFLSAIQR